MDRTEWNTWFAATPAFGIVYGFALLAVSCGAAGPGHGTYVVMGVASSPISLFHDILTSLIATPFLWLTVGFVAARSRFWICRFMFLGLMAAHYAGLVWVLEKPSPFADFEYAQRPAVRSLYWTGLCVYVLGQAVLWAIFVLDIVMHYRKRLESKGTAT